MKTRVLIIIGMISFFTIISIPFAYASQCIGGLTLEDNYNSYDYIFSGRVESIDYSQAPTNVTLWVYNTWKGNTTQYMSVTAPIHDPLLGFLFVEGEDYLIFSELGYWTNVSIVNGCSPSGLLSQSYDAIMQLEEITNYTNSKKPCNSDRVACYTDQIVCDRSEWECRGGGDSTGVFSKIIELPESVEPIPTKDELAKTSILCIGGYKQAGSECVPDDTLTISYGHQWILKIILIIAILVAISVGIILGVKVWRKRK